MAQGLPYEQEGFQATHAQGVPQVVSTPWNELVGHAYDGVMKNIDEVTQQAVKLEDFTAKQKADYSIAWIRQKADSDLNERLGEIDGSERSFYNADGSLRKNKVRDFMSSYKKDLDSVAKLGVTPQTQEENYWKVQNAFMGMTNNLLARGQEKQKNNAVKAVMNNYRLALSQNRFGDASNIAKQGEENGVLLNGEGQLLSFDAIKTGMRSSFDELLEADPEQAGRLLSSGQMNRYFTPNERASMRQQIQKVIEDKDHAAAANTSMPANMLDDNTPAGRRAKKAIEEPESTGSFTPEEIAWYTRLRAGDIEGAKKDIMSAMKLEAQSFDPDEDPDIARIKFVDRYIKFQSAGKPLFTKEEIERIYKNGRKAYDEYQYSPIDAQARINMLADNKQLVNDERWGGIQKEIDNGAADPDGKYFKAYKSSISLNPDAHQLNKLYITKELFKAHIQENKNRIIEAYTNWKNSPEGKEANALVQSAKLQEIIKTVTGRDTDWREWDKQYNQVLGYNKSKQKDARNAYLFMQDYVVNNEALRFAASAFQFPTADTPVPPPVPVLAGYASTDIEVPEDGILLPKSMMEGVEEGKSIVSLQFSNRHVRTFRVVGSCDGDKPLMSSKLGDLGFNVNTTQRASMTMLSPKAGDAAMKIQNNLYNQQRTDVNRMGEWLLGAEARRDKNGNLAVYYLPKGDGGGRFEVAGINERFHPAEAIKLKGLIEAGKYKEAEEEAKRYIIKFTNPVTKLLRLDQGRTYSPGVEYIMRDLFLNSGEGGATTVLNRALSLPDKASQEQRRRALEAYEGDDYDLLNLIRKEREKYYRGIARKNPNKRQFLNGWLNRLNSVTSKAITMVNPRDGEDII